MIAARASNHSSPGRCAEFALGFWGAPIIAAAVVPRQFSIRVEKP